MLALAFAGASCLIALPVHAQLFGGDDTARKQIVEQQKRIDALQGELKQLQDSLDTRLARIEEALKNQPVLALATQFELFRQEVNNLRGQIEVLSNNVEGTAKRQRDMYVDLDTRLRRLEQPAAVAPPAAPAVPVPAGSPSPPTASSATAPAQIATAATPADEGHAYEAAQKQRRIGNYQGTIAAFQAFLVQYPKSTLAPRAQYWIGDSYFNLRDFKNAIASQQTLIKTYPESTSVPDALLNIASSQLEMGDTATAKKTMDGLVTRYPVSEAAEKAKRRLATLK